MKIRSVKTIFSFLIAAILLFSVITINVGAENHPTIIVSNATGAIGETVDVTISLSGNPGIVSMTLTVSYDSDKLELVGVSDSGLLSGETHKPELISPYTLAWENDTANENISVNGVIATLSFKISDSAVAGESYSVNISYDLENWDIYDYDSNMVEFEIDNGLIKAGCEHKVVENDAETRTVKCSECGEELGKYVLGDVNLDGSIDSTDYMRIKSHFLGTLKIEGSAFFAADVNMDKTIDSADYMRIKSHFLGIFDLNN